MLSHKTFIARVPTCKEEYKEEEEEEKKKNRRQFNTPKG